MDNRDESFIDNRCDTLFGLLERIAKALEDIKEIAGESNEEARKAGRAEAEREFEKVASDKAERETEEDYKAWLAKQTI